MGPLGDEMGARRRGLVIIIAVFVVAAGSAVIYRIGPGGFHGPDSRMKTVYLFYYNKTRDVDASGQIRCSPESVIPVKRAVPGNAGKKEILERLLDGKLTREEKAAGFETEFPHPKFRLRKVDFNESTGCLTLWFTPVPGFTTGGSCRTGLLSAQIRKTAANLAGVRDVQIRPETLFQP